MSEMMKEDVEIIVRAYFALSARLDASAILVKAHQEVVDVLSYYPDYATNFLTQEERVPKSKQIIMEQLIAKDIEEIKHGIDNDNTEYLYDVLSGGVPSYRGMTYEELKDEWMQRLGDDE